MVHTVRIRIKPEESADLGLIKQRLESMAGEPVFDWRIIRKSIDARQRQIWIELEIAYTTETGETVARPIEASEFKHVGADAPSVVIVGAGPAGLFAALRALQLGWRPIVVERGKPVEERLKDIVELQKHKVLNPESNFCFGEGGAGAFSDGKLFTRSKKRGNVKEVLELLCQHGAKPEIMYEAHPHIGSDRLPKIIRSIRETIINHGGEVRFSTKFSRLIIEGGEVKGIETSDGQRIWGPVILATGHSARDVYESLHKTGVDLQAKGFAMGVRLEHPQPVIDRMVYHNPKGRGEYLPPAEYKMVTQSKGRGVYTFCMCPGGVIVPAVSAPGESVVNGMSASGRSGKWANTGMVVEMRPEDFPDYEKYGALGMLRLQEETERRFYEESGGLNAPAQRMKDFVEGKKSKDLPPTSYVPGIHTAELDKLLPSFVSERLREGLATLGKKNKEFLTNEAVMIGLESRTSSPVRIPRDAETLQHPSLKGLFPVGEGAGFAGGIVSAAMDGIKAMNAVASGCKQPMAPLSD